MLHGVYFDQNPPGQMDRMALQVEISTYINTLGISANQTATLPVAPFPLGTLTGSNALADTTKYFFPDRVICGIGLKSNGGCISLVISTSNQVPIQPQSEVYLYSPIIEPQIIKPIDGSGDSVNCSPVWTRSTNEVVTGVQLLVRNNQLILCVQVSKLRVNTSTPV